MNMHQYLFERSKIHKGLKERFSIGRNRKKKRFCLESTSLFFFSFFCRYVAACEGNMVATVLAFPEQFWCSEVCRLVDIMQSLKEVTEMTSKVSQCKVFGMPSLWPSVRPKLTYNTSTQVRHSIQYQYPVLSNGLSCWPAVAAEQKQLKRSLHLHSGFVC